MGIILIGCEQVPTNPGPASLLQERVAARFATGDTLSVPPETLRQKFPDSWGEWSEAGSKASLFKDQEWAFPTAEARYRQLDQTTYLSLELADYAEDSLGLYRLRAQWPEVSYLRELPTRGVSLEASRIAHFRSSGATRLELIYGGRYLLTLQTNHPEGEKQLLGALKHLNW